MYDGSILGINFGPSCEFPYDISEPTTLITGNTKVPDCMFTYTDSLIDIGDTSKIREELLSFECTLEDMGTIEVNGKPVYIG